INIVTKHASESKGLSMSAEGASFGTYRGQMAFGHIFANGLDVLISGSHYNAKGPRRLFFKAFDDPATNNGVAQDADYDQYTRFFSNAKIRGFTFQAVYGDRTKGVPTGSFGTVFNDKRNQTTDQRSYASLLYDHTFKDSLNLQTRISYDRYY